MSDSESVERSNSSSEDQENFEVNDFLADAPSQVKAFAARLYQRSGPVFHPIFDKMGPEHVGVFLEQSHEEEMDDRMYRRTGRRYRLFYVLLAVALALFLLLFLHDRDRQLLIEIFKLGAAFVAGIGTGQWIRWKNR